MSRYMTDQRRALLDYLSLHADQALTAAEIARGLAGETISRSAVYRNLAALEQSGALRCGSKSGSRERVYQYCAAPACRGHLHLSCTRCGRITHLSVEASSRFIRSIEQSDGFSIDSSETVLQGLCRACR